MKLLRLLVATALAALSLSLSANITSTTNKVGPVTVAGLPQTVPITIPFQQGSDLLVLDQGASGTGIDPPNTLTLNSDYTVTGGGYNAANQMLTGSITLVSGGAHTISTGDYIVILRNVTPNQTTSFGSTGPLTITQIEQGLDKLTTIEQQQNETISRTLRFEAGEGRDGTMQWNQRLGKLVGFDASGNMVFSGSSTGGGQIYTAGTGLNLTNNIFSVLPTQSLTGLTVTNAPTFSALGTGAVKSTAGVLGNASTQADYPGLTTSQTNVQFASLGVGAAPSLGLFQVGTGSGQVSLVINGGASGTAGGPVLSLDTNGGANSALGTYSAIYCGAYNNVTTLYAPNNLALMGGNVGVATITPGAHFEAYGTGTSPVSSGTTTTGISRIHASTNSVIDSGGLTAANGAWMQVYDATNLAIQYTLGLQPVGGSLGIGTTAPGAWKTMIANDALGLDTLGTMLRVGGGPTSGLGPVRFQFSVYPATAGANRYALLTAGDDSDFRNLSLQPAGYNVGIGTTSPGFPLEVDGSLGIASKDSGVTVRMFASSAVPAGFLETYTNHDLILRTNQAERMRITAAGLVTLIGSITTGAPTGGTAGAWKFGVYVTGAAVLDAAHYVQLDVGGTLYKLALAQ